MNDQLLPSGVSMAEFLGFSLVREEGSPRTQLIHVADRSVWQDISELAVRVPSPPTMPIGGSVWQGVNHLIDCYTQVMLHLEHPKYPARSTQHVIKGMLAKNQVIATTATTFVQSCQQLAAEGSGLSPLFWTLWRIKRLLDTGVSLQQIRLAVDQLRAAGFGDLAKITLMSDGARVYLCTTQDEVIDLVGRGQGVFGIAVGRVLREVEATLVNMTPSSLEDIDELAARRSAKRAV